MKPRKKTATLPSLRVDPDLRADAEAVLGEGESLSAFIEDSIRRQVNYRRVHKEFIERALRAEREAEETGRYHSIDEVMGKMRAIVDQAEKRSKQRT